MSVSRYSLLLACAVFAAASPAAAEVAATPTMETIDGEAADPAVLGDPAALSDDELDVLRGGEAILLSNQTLVAITTGNVISGDYVAGNVTLSDFALSNFNGVGNVLINTGGQVSLQTGMNLTINVGE
jgi:opacity protein-like surface antigen